jgi:hypothetical protein
MKLTLTKSIRDWGFNALALIFFVVGLYSLLWMQPFRNATAALIAAAFCALMGNPNRFQIKFSLLTGYRSNISRSDPASGGEQICSAPDQQMVQQGDRFSCP